MAIQDQKLLEPPRQYRKWNTTGAQIVTKSGFVDVVKLCNGFTVTNTGTDTVRVNDAVLFPGTFGSVLGDSRTFGGNEGEIYVGNIKISFTLPAGANPQVEIIQKFYVEDETK